MSAETDAGLAALQNNDIPGAIAQLERAVATDPTDFQAQLYLGAAYGQAGRQMDAVTAVTQAVTLQPSNAQARYNLAIAYESAGYPEQALVAAQQALQLQPDYPKALEAVTRLSGASAAPPAYVQPSTTQPTPYGQPAAPQYGQPDASQPTPYGQPAAPQYGQPAAPQYGQPAAPYGQPQATPYGAPAPYQAQGAAAYGGAPMRTNAMAYGMGSENTSGMKSTVPMEVTAGGWNWGAFYFSWIWCFGNGMPLIGLGILVANCLPLGGLIAMIVLGIQGNKLAWQNRRFDSVDHFFAVQRSWAKWALGFFIASIILAVIYVVLIAGSVSRGGGFPAQ